ncbi:TRAF3-interacting JNK-activating modulator [Cynoglossus semilaevis]|uniref:TRAF3-interacting JNK-activating modulator-like n=1 Tax=Cynoglossus semilaevis TaxID=244447 RepID=A0A3P8VB27_CYNSE|nr:TRAF3-interacting JNK-activating modulator-like [Cynoglossus semilaevis]XP_024915059.1 TRAF3-interacting JNK-activating modulator-like [Cynoglossus semilaevis]
MDILYHTQFPEVRGFDKTAVVRAEKRELLRRRNNVTLCRSQNRDFEGKLIKSELKEKRQLEYLKRRSVSPELCGVKLTRTKNSTKTMSVKPLSYHMYTNVTTIPANGHKKVVSAEGSSTADDPSSSARASSWTEQVTLVTQEKSEPKQQDSTSTTEMKDLNQSRTERAIDDEASSLTREDQREGSHQTTVHTTKIISTHQEAAVQTESGLVTVKESDIQQLGQYLEEALLREAAANKKLLALKESTSSLMSSSDTTWTPTQAPCSEDLLKSNIEALEAQLQVCLQKVPKEMKKLVKQMEKKKVIYEEKTLLTLKTITQEKTDAVSKAETLQESLSTAEAESLKWKNLYQELKLSYEQLQENQHLSNEQLQQLHREVELSRSREDEMRDTVVSLRQVNEELQNNIGLLEEDNHSLKEEIQNLRENDSERRDVVMQDHLTSQNVNKQLTLKTDFQVEEQLRHTQERLRLKEEECDELQTVLNTLEQECQSTQGRLSQCRDELRQLSHCRSEQTHCGPWWRVWVVFLLFLAIMSFIILWLCHPQFREQIDNLYSDIGTRIENYLLEMVSPRHSGCFRPM